MQESDFDLLVRAAISSMYRMSSLRGMGSQHNYRKIAQELERLETPLHSMDDLRSIRCVGARTIEKVQECIDRDLSRRVRSAEDLERYAGIISPTAYEKIRCRLSGHGDGEGKETVRRAREYIPGYRTGGYAILKALWVKDGITKHGIAHLGRAHCDSEFDFSSRHSAWTSMKTLIRRDLVYREGRSRFYLTEEGRRVAENVFANTSTVEDERSGVVLVVDSREIKSKKCRAFFQNYLEARKVAHETRVLEVGDFLWIRNERICGVIVERKGGLDFVSSISDGRFDEQKRRLGGCGMERVFYFVEGLGARHMQRIGQGLAMACLTRTKLEGFVVVETGDISETGAVICMIDEEVRSGRKMQDGGEDNLLDICEDSSEDSPGMTYGSFVDKGAKERNESPEHMFYLALLSIRGISHGKAGALSRRYGSIGGLLEEMEHPESLDGLYAFEVDGKRMPRKNVDDVVQFFLR